MRKLSISIFSRCMSLKKKKSKSYSKEHSINWAFIWQNRLIKQKLKYSINGVKVSMWTIPTHQEVIWRPWWTLVYQQSKENLNLASLRCKRKQLEEWTRLFWPSFHLSLLSGNSKLCYWEELNKHRLKYSQVSIIHNFLGQEIQVILKLGI